MTFFVELSITGAGEVSCGDTARFEANVFEANANHSIESTNWSRLTWQKSKGRITEQIDIWCEKYKGSDGRQLVINSVCNKDEGEYKATYLYGENRIAQSNSIYLKPLGGTFL